MVEADLVQIRSFWPEIPTKIDAAYEHSDKDRVLLFRGKLRKKIFFKKSLNYVLLSTKSDIPISVW